MTLAKQKELYKTGEWVCLMKNRFGDTNWSIHNNPKFRDGWNYQLIHKSHEHILDAYLDGCEVYSEQVVQVYHMHRDADVEWILSKNFIVDYKDTNVYLAAPKTLENCYCDVNELHYDKLVESNYPEEDGDAFKYLVEEYFNPEDTNYFQVGLLNQFRWSTEVEDEKKIEYNEQINNWVYCPKENEDDDTTTTNQLSITNDIPNSVDSNTNTSINNFPDYGFTADLEGEILKEVEDKYIGWHKRNGYIQSYTWNLDGRSTFGNPEYNLTPIQPEMVYPIFKKTSSGVVAKIESNGNRTLVLCEDPKQLGAVDRVQCEDSWIDIPYDSERELYHGQPCYAVYKDERTIFNFDINETYRVTIEAVTLDELKHMRWVWKQYKKFIGN